MNTFGAGGWRSAGFSFPAVVPPWLGSKPTAPAKTLDKEGEKIRLIMCRFLALSSFFWISHPVEKKKKTENGEVKREEK